MPVPVTIELRRHYGKLSSKETDEVVEAVAGLMLEFLKQRPVDEQENKAHEHGFEKRTDTGSAHPCPTRRNGSARGRLGRHHR